METGRRKRKAGGITEVGRDVMRVRGSRRMNVNEQM